MFGNLFEDDTSGTGAHAPSKTHHSGLRQPEEVRQPGGFMGLRNQGATCYLNSLLQACYMTPEFRGGLYSVDPSELNVQNWNAEDGGKDVKKQKPKKIPIELQLLFTRLQMLDQATVATTHLTERGFQWQDNQGGVQHDAHELNRKLFEAIERNLKGTSGAGLIERLYQGKWATQTICTVCKTVSERCVFGGRLWGRVRGRVRGRTRGGVWGRGVGSGFSGGFKIREEEVEKV